MSRAGNPSAPNKFGGTTSQECKSTKISFWNWRGGRSLPAAITGLWCKLRTRNFLAELLDTALQLSDMVSQRLIHFACVRRF
jgi:hypothetical protein